MKLNIQVKVTLMACRLSDELVNSKVPVAN